VTANQPKKMILSASITGLGQHLGAWMVRKGKVSDYVSPHMYIDIARTAEAAKLHNLFFADGISLADGGTTRPAPALDPMLTLALMAAVTDRIGLVATASTTYSAPYTLARGFGSLDHLSRGRAGWNCVSTFLPATAAQFGGAQLPDHTIRYARAEEFVQVVMKLWDSWEEGALVGDAASAVFAHDDMVHEINHIGEHFSVKGPLPFPRSPQGRPVIFQAGASSEGMELAAKYADVVFTAQHLIENAVGFRAEMRSRAGRYGRQLKVLPGFLVHLGATEAEAKARRRELDDALGIGADLDRISKRTGIPIDRLELDEPFPAHLVGPDEDFEGSVGFRRTLVSLAVRHNLTVRELLVRYGTGHHCIVGTPEQVADDMEEWFKAGAVDGFNLMVDVLPSGVYDIKEMLVPELKRRGLFHDDYEYETLRENLGLS